MVVNLTEILDAAMKLPESDRLLIVTRLMDSLPAEPPGLSEDDPNFLAELERRAADAQPPVSPNQLWNQD